jgi:hypothetical protein
VIARRIRNHPGGASIRRKLGEHVVGAADLERAGRLHVLAFDRKSEFAMEAADINERCASSDAGDPRGRGTDVAERDKRS